MSDLDTTHDLITRNIAAWNMRDPRAVAETYRDDAVFESPILVTGSVRGRDAIANIAIAPTMRAFPDFTLEERERWVSADGRTAAVFWTTTGTFLGRLDPPGFAPTGGRVSITGMSRSEIEGGAVARFQLYFDVAALGRQLAAMPEMGSGRERMIVRMQHLAARKLRKQNAA
ncbi:MAG: nuclear transport factor 2 family protein [Actinobacteria bacterium]|nr:nuclear transport factor 2 family protein [Actinomycetota bacterium]